MKCNGKVLVAGIAIILVTNAVALLGVAYNRSGEPDALVEFTEREVRIYHSYRSTKEDTVLFLRFYCRIENKQDYSYGHNDTNCSGTPVWLDQAKMIQLGFEFTAEQTEKCNHRRDNRNRSKKVFLVLEYDGASYQRMLTSAAIKLSEQQQLFIENPGKKEFEKLLKTAQENLQKEQHSNSRLFAVDAGLDKDELRDQYPDSTQYIIMQGLLKHYYANHNKTCTVSKHRITALLVNKINISLQNRTLFESLGISRYEKEGWEPRYKVRTAFGKRSEPWVLSVSDYSEISD